MPIQNQHLKLRYGFSVLHFIKERELIIVIAHRTSKSIRIRIIILSLNVQEY